MIKSKYIKLFQIAYLCFVVCLFFNIEALAANSTALAFSKLDTAGETIMEIIKKFGYWVALVKCGMDVVRNAMNGDMHALGKTIMTYVILYACLFFLPWMFHLVEDIF